MGFSKGTQSLSSDCLVYLLMHETVIEDIVGNMPLVTHFRLQPQSKSDPENQSNGKIDLNLGF